MYYEVNIAKGGKHFFATHKRSITTVQELKNVYSELSKVFNPDNGYTMMITLYSTRGEPIDPDNIL